MQITNLAKYPLRIPLPAGKKLFLGLGQSGQITQKAAESKAVVKLIETEDVKVSEEGAKRQGNGKCGGVSNASGHSGTGGMRQSGDK